MLAGKSHQCTVYRDFKSKYAFFFNPLPSLSVGEGESRRSLEGDEEGEGREVEVEVAIKASRISRQQPRKERERERQRRVELLISEIGREKRGGEEKKEYPSGFLFFSLLSSYVCHLAIFLSPFLAPRTTLMPAGEERGGGREMWQEEEAGMALSSFSFSLSLSLLPSSSSYQCPAYLNRRGERSRKAFFTAFSL